MKTRLAIYTVVLTAVLCCGVRSFCDTPPYSETWTSTTPFLSSDGAAVANGYTGVLGAYALTSIVGGAQATAAQGLTISVDVSTNVTVTFAFRWQGACVNPGLTPTSWTGMRLVWYVDDVLVSTKDLTPLFRLDDLASKTITLVSNAFGVGGVTKVKDALLILRGVKDAYSVASVITGLSPRISQATFTFWATAGKHYIRVGVQAGASSFGLSYGQALVLGTVTSIDATATNYVTRIEVRGPSAVSQRSSANFSCIAYFRDGSWRDVTRSPGCKWRVNTSKATISSTGTLSVGALASNVTCSVSASYSYFLTPQTGRSLEATRSVTLAK